MSINKKKENQELADIITKKDIIRKAAVLGAEDQEEILKDL